MDVAWVATVVIAVAGVLGALASLYLLGLSLAAFRPARSHPPGPGRSRLAVLVPAHDEAELLPRCLASLRAQDYPRDLVRVVVIADNCSDRTAELAQRGGAEVLVRDDPVHRGKGHALRWGMDRLLSRSPGPDAVVVVDADSVADADLLRQLEGAMLRGAEAVQAEYLVLDGGSAGTALRQAAFLLFHRTRFAGRAALGLPCALVGNGMLLTRSLLERIPWDAFSATEDLEYSITLRLHGVRPRFAPAAGVAGPASALGRAGATQRMRWEGGRFHAVRRRLPRLLASALRRRDLSLLDAALDLAVPPLGLQALIAAVGGAACLAAALAGAMPLWPAVLWWSVLPLLSAHVLLGLRAAGAPRSILRAVLLGAPRFLVVKLGTYLAMTRGLHAERWERTVRPSEAGPRHHARRAEGRRVTISGVPVDPVDEREALERVMAAARDRAPLQVCTVNLQFLVTARRQPQVRRVLARSGLNLADGAPVVWLAHLLGHPLPGRVTGVDLVPALAGRAVRDGLRLYLLGGCDGAASAAAEALRRRHPGLAVCGVDEPPVRPLAEMDSEAIVARVRAARPDILLVGLGHPKQDLWIAANLAALEVPAAIGVGGTFDLIAGRLRRAPGWARATGLEWLFRLLQEPRRLALRYASCAAWLVGVLAPMAAWQRLAGSRGR